VEEWRARAQHGDGVVDLPAHVAPQQLHEARLAQLEQRATLAPAMRRVPIAVVVKHQREVAERLTAANLYRVDGRALALLGVHRDTTLHDDRGALEHDEHRSALLVREAYRAARLDAPLREVL
jgi:hypothetical protein